MKFVIKVLLCFVAVVHAQDEEAAEEGAGEEVAAEEGAGEEAASLETGAVCINNNECAAGLCCAEGVFKEDVVDGEVSENYRDNVISVCNGEKETEFANDDGEEYWMACLADIEGAAAYIAPIASAAVTAAYLSFWWGTDKWWIY